MKKSKAGDGSITQWISTCRCDELIVERLGEQEAIQLCPLCNKRVSAGRAGSLTQWVFRSDICTCNDKTDKLALSRPRIRLQARVEEQNASVEISVDAQSFPCDRYGALEEIGMGVSGKVYLAVDRLLKKRVAIKCLKSLTKSQLVSFQKEAQATSKLNHPGIVKIFDFGVVPSGAPYMVMELVDGTSIQDYIRSNGPLPEGEGLMVLLYMCRALEHAHMKGVFHRDVKSSNVLVTAGQSGQFDVRIIDFGVALSKSTAADTKNDGGHAVVGTPAYMAPDLIQGKAFDARSEIYSLGCLFFELLTGVIPYDGESSIEMLKLHVNAPTPKLRDRNPHLSYSAAAESLVAKCLAKDPADRFQTMNELSCHIEELLDIRRPDGIVEEYDTAGSELDELNVSKNKVPIKLLVISSILGCIVFGLAMITLLKDAGENVKVTAPTVVPVEGSTIKDITGSLEDSLDGEDLVAITAGNDESLKKLNGRAGIKIVQLLGCRLTGNGLKYLETLPNLERLLLANTVLEPSALSVLSNLKLKSLLVRNYRVIDEVKIACIAGMPLEVLSFESTNISDDMLEPLADMRKLKNLSFLRCPRITGEGLTFLQGVPISTLKLIDVPLTKAGCDVVARMQSLTCLMLTDDTIDGFRRFARMRKPSNPYHMSSFTKLTAVADLQTVVLDSDKMTPKHFEVLARVPNLKILVLAGQYYNRPPLNLAALKKAQKLYSMRFLGRCLSRDDLIDVAKLTPMSRLTFADVDLTDSDLNVLSQSSTTELNIIGENSLSDSGLSYLAKMPNLRVLRLPAGITQYGIKAFASLKPNCLIEQSKTKEFK